jgi:hypothetical protein
MSQSPSHNGDRGASDDTSGTERPIDTDEIPDHWDIGQIHKNDPESVQLEYHNPDDERSEPSAIILLQTPETARGQDMGYSVEVQDVDADGKRHGLLPRAEWIPIWQRPAADSEVDVSPLDLAVRHVHRLAKEYPLQLQD